MKEDKSIKYSLKWEPTPESDKFKQPEKMSTKEKFFWAGILIGGLLANIVWVIILRDVL